MEEFIDKKIEEMGRGMAVSFDKGTDNYNKMRKILMETYHEGYDKGVDYGMD